MSWNCVTKNTLTLSWRRFCKTSWKRLEDVLKTYGQDEYISLDQDVRLRGTYSSWSKRLQDVFKTSSSRRMFAGNIYIIGFSKRNFFDLWKAYCKKRIIYALKSCRLTKFYTPSIFVMQNWSIIVFTMVWNWVTFNIIWNLFHKFEIRKMQVYKKV